MHGVVAAHRAVRGFERVRRVALASVAVSATLSAMSVVVGLLTGSTAVVAIGVEFAGDVLASAVVLVGVLLASRPPDSNHPYGHGRLETLAGLLVGIILIVGGVGVGYRSLQASTVIHDPPGAAAIWALLSAVAVRTVMSVIKFRVGRQTGSTSLVADAWNDAIDILSATAALVAVGLARQDPARFLVADHYGGFAVGLVVVITGVRVVRDASVDLADTMPPARFLEDVRQVAGAVPGVLGVEKQFARKTGLKYHVDLHIEVDPGLTVHASHLIAHDVRARLVQELDWVADVLVHIEPHMARAGAEAPALHEPAH